MYRRAVFGSVGGFDSSVNATADWDLYLRIAREYPVHHHGEVVAEYRQHGTNMTGNPALMLKATVDVLRAQQKHIKGHKPYEEAYASSLREGQERYGTFVLEELRTYLISREWKAAIAGLLLLLRYYPQGLALLSERRMGRHRGRRRERRKLTRRIQTRKQELETCEQRLRKLGNTEESENALVKERREVQLLRRRVRQLERRMQDLDQRVLWKPLNKLDYLRGRMLGR